MGQAARLLLSAVPTGVQLPGRQTVWGLEDFMNIRPIAVTNAANLSLFMVNLSSHLLCSLRTRYSGAGIQDLKSWYRGQRYASAMLKMLPERPDAIICSQLVEQVCRLGFIHSPHQSAPYLEMAA